MRDVNSRRSLTWLNRAMYEPLSHDHSVSVSEVCRILVHCDSCSSAGPFLEISRTSPGEAIRKGGVAIDMTPFGKVEGHNRSRQRSCCTEMMRCCHQLTQVGSYQDVG